MLSFGCVTILNGRPLSTVTVSPAGTFSPLALTVPLPLFFTFTPSGRLVSATSPISTSIVSSGKASAAIVAIELPTKKSVLPSFAKLGICILFLPAVAAGWLSGLLLTL